MGIGMQKVSEIKVIVIVVFLRSDEGWLDVLFETKV